MKYAPTMRVRDFIALKEDPSFEGFASNHFCEFEWFEDFVNDLEAAGVDIGSASVSLMDPRYGGNRLYSDVIFLPYTEKLSYAAVEAIVGARPDEFGLSLDKEFIRLWWD